MTRSSRGLALAVARTAKAGTAGTLSIRYEEKPGDYAAFDAVQLLVLPGDAFAVDGRAFADRTLAFSRSAKGVYAVEVTFAVERPTLVVVGYGPFVGPDTSRDRGCR